MNYQNPPPECIEAEVIEPDGTSREQAFNKIRLPAICLIVLWALTFFNFIFEILLSLTGLRNQMLESLAASVPPEMQGQLNQFMNLSPGLVNILSFFSLFICILALVGTVKMLKMQSYGLALTSAILSLIPCFGPCCCCSMLLIPFGIWALVILSDTTVKQQFR